MLSWYENIMKIWEAMNDVAWVHHYPQQPMGVAGCACISGYRCITGLVVPAFAGNKHYPQDCVLSEASGRAGAVIVFD